MREPTLIVAFLISWAAGGASAVEVPVAVSPGGPANAPIEGRCPTFSWGGAPGTASYELVVYRIGAQAENLEELLRQSFPGSVDSWTPSLVSCLAHDERYAWSVRAVGAEGVSEWSPPLLFEVASRPSDAEFEEAVALVRRYLEQESEPESQPKSAERRRTSRAESVAATGDANRGTGGAPAPLSALAGDPGLQVNGAAVVTTATLAPALCQALTYRYVDLADGTVFDCKTGKMWLKQATCLGPGMWDSGGAAGSIQEKVADLNDTGIGTDFGCQDYIDGTYSDWRASEMHELCGLWTSPCIGTHCCTASAGIVDTSQSNPAVANAFGDGPWSEENAFVGVDNVAYWSATGGGIEGGGIDKAWDVSIGNGNVGNDDQTFELFVWPVRGTP